MNIFVLDRDPRLAARMLCDRHLGKLLIESAQLLSTAHHMLDKRAPVNAYKPTHVNHPCSIWTRSASLNYRWLWNHADEIGIEYRRRYGRFHKSHFVVHNLRLEPRNIAHGETDFAQAMPNIYKRLDPVLAYRLYYVFEKQGFAKWKYPGVEPAWFTIAKLEHEKIRLSLKNQSVFTSLEDKRCEKLEAVCS